MKLKLVEKNTDKDAYANNGSTTSTIQPIIGFRPVNAESDEKNVSIRCDAGNHGDWRVEHTATVNDTKRLATHVQPAATSNFCGGANIDIDADFDAN